MTDVDGSPAPAVPVPDLRTTTASVTHPPRRHSASRAAWTGGLAVVRGTGAALKGRDLSIVAAGLTYFAGIALVPWLLLGVWSATLLTSAATVTARAAELRLLVPDAIGAPEVWDRVVAAGVAIGPLGALVALFPASFYGEGLRRACLRVAPRPDRFTGWRARVAVLPLVVLVPLLPLGLLAASGVLADLARTGGPEASVASVVIVFHLVWLGLGAPLAWVFRIVAPGSLSLRATLVGAFTTSAVLSGFLQGFVLFLAIPLHLGVPFGGLTVVGAVVAIGLWLFVLHVLVLVGWTATTVLDGLWRGDPTGRGAGA
jgi:membrane protein